MVFTARPLQLDLPFLTRRHTPPPTRLLRSFSPHDPYEHGMDRPPPRPHPDALPHPDVRRIDRKIVIKKRNICNICVKKSMFPVYRFPCSVSRKCTGHRSPVILLIPGFGIWDLGIRIWAFIFSLFIIHRSPVIGHRSSRFNDCTV